jgi:palmitoyl-protein thioesterase
MWGDSVSTIFMREVLKLMPAGTLIKCVESGANVVSAFTPLQSQIDTACEKIDSDPDLAGPYIMVGLSQGGIIARGVVQTCAAGARATRLLTLGTPNAGAAHFPHCFNSTNLLSRALCGALENKVKSMVYEDFWMDHFSPFNFYKDLDRYQLYLNKSIVA